MRHHHVVDTPEPVEAGLVRGACRIDGRTPATRCVPVCGIMTPNSMARTVSASPRARTGWVVTRYMSALDVGRERDRVADRVVEGPAVVGQVEVLDADPAGVVEPLELGEHGGEVDVTTLVGVELRTALRGLAQLHVVGVAQQRDGIAAPGRHVAGVEGEAQAGHRGDQRLDFGVARRRAAGPGLEPGTGVAAEQFDGLVEAVFAATLEGCHRRAPLDHLEPGDAIADGHRQIGELRGVEPVDGRGRRVEVVEAQVGGALRGLVDGGAAERHRDDADGIPHRVSTS